MTPNEQAYADFWLAEMWRPVPQWHAASKPLPSRIRRERHPITVPPPPPPAPAPAPSPNGDA